MNTITLMTATGAENLWDELITLCEIENFRTIDAGVKIILFSHDPARTWRFLHTQNIATNNLTILPYFPTHIRRNPIKNIWYFLQTLQTLWISEHIYIGGGGLLYGKDEEWHSPLRLWWMRAMLAKILRKPLTYLSLGVSTNKQELQKYAYGLFHNAAITVRDLESQKRIIDVWYTAKLQTDPVFTYLPTSQKLSSKREWKIIGLALRSWFVSDEIILATIKILLQKNYEIYLLPHSLHPDDVKSHDGYYLQQFLLPGVKITQTIEQTLATYEKCNIVIGMRLHSIILASVLHIPLVAISYSIKTHTILTEMWQDFFEAKNVTSNMLIQKIENLVAQ